MAGSHLVVCPHDNEGQLNCRDADRQRRVGARRDEKMKFLLKLKKPIRNKVEFASSGLYEVS